MKYLLEWPLNVIETVFRSFSLCKKKRSVANNVTISEHFRIKLWV